MHLHHRIWLPIQYLVGGGWWVFRYKWIALVGYPAFCVLWLYSCSNWLAYFDQVLAAFIFKLAGWYYALSIYTSCRFYIKVVGCIVFGHSWMSFGIVFGQLDFIGYRYMCCLTYSISLAPGPVLQQVVCIKWYTIAWVGFNYLHILGLVK